MRRIAGLAVFVLGVGGLGYWATSRSVPLIEQKILAGSQAVSARVVHPLVLQISGRDIEAKGVADSELQRAEVITALNEVRGRREVRAQIDVLPIVSPYVLEISKIGKEAPLVATGNAPSEAMAASIGLGGMGLTLANGAPQDWVELAKTGIGALSVLNEGTMILRDQNLQVIGTAATPRDLAMAKSILTKALGAQSDIEVADDGKPVAWQLRFTAAEGAKVSGKLPLGLDPSALAAALKLPQLSGTPLVATKGAAFAVTGLQTLAPWFSKVETLALSWTEQEKIALVEVQEGAQVQGLKAALQNAGFTTEINVIKPMGNQGAQRTNAASGAQEHFMGGYWLVDPEVEVSLAGCQAASDQVLKNRTINFITSSSDLDGSALEVINDLARYMRACAQTSGLRVEIGGHTDNSGDALTNLDLSARRAEAVRRELISRGVAANGLTARGYGMEQPIADNNSEEGRAKNRRTSIVWSK